MEKILYLHETCPYCQRHDVALRFKEDKRAIVLQTHCIGCGKDVKEVKILNMFNTEVLEINVEVP